MSNDGGFDLNNLMQQAQAMQQQMEAAQEQQAATTLTGSAGGGKVTVEATGGGEFRAVKIDRDAVDPDDVELLEELVLAALHDVTAQIGALQSDALGGMDLPDLGGLGGLLGDS
jgi:DNA-binding YbaB/EbfC family protein